MNFFGQAAQAQEALPLIDKIARADDRWLFIALLLLTIAATIWLVRWLVSSFTEIVKQGSSVIQRNTDVIEQNNRLNLEMTRAIQTCRITRPERPQ